MIDLNVISAIVFYILIFLFIVIYRKKFIIQSKIIALYKTKLGLGLMDKIAKKFPRTLRFLGYFGIVIGFLGMIVIVYFMVAGAFSLIADPNAPPTVAPIIPGVKIPGSPIYVPFWYGIISLFVIIVIHEFSHGVLSRVHNIPVDSSGFGMFAFFPIAFVEPNEKKLLKAKKKDQLSIFAAGPFSNILTAVIVIFLVSFVTYPVQESLVEFDGVRFSEIIPDEPSFLAGVQPEIVYTHLDGQQINSSVDFLKVLDTVGVGDVVVLSNENLSHSITTGSNPQNSSRAYLGVMGIFSSFHVKDGSSKFSFYFWDIVNNLFSWIFILSVGIGLANLLPLGPVDGGKMLYLVMDGKKEFRGVFKYISLFILLLLLFNLLFPYLRGFIGL